MKTIRIFISSPNDVVSERQICGKVIERIQGRYWSLIRIEDVFWENEAVRATATFQDEIDDPADCEIVIGIIWTKMGSPLPERFTRLDGRSHAPGTEWEIGRAISAYEEKLTKGGDPKTTTPHVVVYRRRDTRSPIENPAKEAEAAAQERDVHDFFAREFHNNDQHHTFKRASISYGDTKKTKAIEDFEGKLQRQLTRLVLKQIPVLKSAFNLPPIGGSPFKGLASFDFIDNDRFFGRTREIREAQRRLISNARKSIPFLLIYGGSGYGKSSLMRAGLAPVITRPGGSLDEIQGWRRVPFQPAIGSGTLCERLSRALLQPPSKEEAQLSREHKHWPLTGLPELSKCTSEGSPWDSASLARHFADDDQRIFAIAAISETLKAHNRHLFLEIDQLEEIFTTKEIADSQEQSDSPKASSINQKQIAAFFSTLGALAQTGRVWIVATMRSEFFPQVAKNPGLYALVGKDRGYILPPPDRHSLREIIRYPALAARLSFEQRIQDYKIAGEPAKYDHLHDQILADAESSPDALPLLEFVLQNLYEERDKEKELLTWSSYAKANGLKGAIAKQATEIYQTLPTHAREASHRVFAALVHIDPAKGTITRQRAPLTSLKTHPGTEAFLNSFLEAHLLVTDEDGNTNQPVVTLAHEALITHWDELATWIKDHRGDILARQRLAEQCRLWIENGKKKSFLLAEARLAEAERIASSNHILLNPDEQSFLELSRKRASSKKRFMMLAVAGFALLSIVASLAGIFAKSQANKATALNHEASRKAHGSARESFENFSDTKRGIAYLVDSLRYHPENQLALADSKLRLLRPSLTEILPMYHPIKSGRKIVSASFTGENLFVRLEASEGIAQEWDPLTGRMLRETANPRKPERFMSPDGKWYVHVWSDARIHQSETGKPVGKPIGSSGGVWAADFTPDSSSVITGGNDGILEVWGVPGGELLQTSEKLDYSISLIRFNADGSRFLVSLERGDNHTPYKHSFQLWDAETFKPIGTPGASSISDARFSPDGTHLVTLSGSDVATLWNAEDLTKPVAKTIPTGTELVDVRFHPSGNMILTVDQSGEARIWDSYLLDEKSNIILKEPEVSEASFSSDGGLMLTTHSDFRVIVWDTQTGEPVGKDIPHDSEIVSASFSPDAKQILTVSQKEIHLWEASSRNLLTRMPLTSGTNSKALFMPDGSGFLTLSSDEGMKRWDAKFEKQIGSSMGGALNIMDCIISDDGKFALTVDDNSMARAWNLSTNKQIGVPVEFSWMGLPIHLAFQPGSHRVALAAGNHYMWDIDESSGLTQQRILEGATNATIFSTDGEYFTIERNAAIAPSGDYQRVPNQGLGIFDAATSKLVRRVKLDHNITSSAFIGESNLVATATTEGLVKVWDVINGYQIGASISGGAAPRKIACTRDASCLLILSSDKILTLMPIKSTLNAAQLSSLLQPLYGSRISPGGAVSIIPGKERLEMIDHLVGKKTGDNEFAQAIQFFFFPEEN